MKNTKIKSNYLASLLMAVMLAVIFSSCGDNSTKTEESSPAKTKAVEIPQYKMTTQIPAECTNSG